jgi:mannosyl-oligosaccharide alpha-1,2-mannosidase
MLAIGSKIFNRPDDLAVAKGLLETCVFMYRTTATKLAPENWGYMHTVPYNPLTYGKSKDELNNSHKWWNWIEGRKEKPTVMEEKPNTTNRTLDPPVEVPDGLVAFDRRYLLRPGIKLRVNSDIY